MINLTIIAVGKLKERYLVDGVNEYVKRITKYAKIDIIEVQDEKNPANDSDAEIKKKLEVEASQIISKIPKEAYLITLEINGDLISSEELALLIDKTTQFESNKIVLIIGGSHGLSDQIKQLSNKSLSFSKMTFPHQLMRLILVEQIYRSLSILNHSSYHK